MNYRDRSIFSRILYIIYHGKFLFKFEEGEKEFGDRELRELSVLAEFNQFRSSYRLFRDSRGV